MQPTNMNHPMLNLSTHVPTASRPLFTEVALQWGQALRSHAAAGDSAGKARNRVSRRKRKAVLSPEEFIAASLSLVLSKRLTAR
jgi:hypothetical protein